MTYCLDTNTVSHFFKGSGRVAERLLATPPTEVALPAVALYELYVGIDTSSARARRRTAFQSFLQAVTVLPFESKAAEASAHLRKTLEADGTPIGPLDVLIAGTALANRATLVTHNVKEFSRVEGLILEDWFAR